MRRRLSANECALEYTKNLNCINTSFWKEIWSLDRDQMHPSLTEAVLVDPPYLLCFGSSSRSRSPTSLSLIPDLRSDRSLHRCSYTLHGFVSEDLPRAWCVGLVQHFSLMLSFGSLPVGERKSKREIMEKTDTVNRCNNTCLIVHKENNIPLTGIGS
jgi:hypothetical protein